MATTVIKSLFNPHKFSATEIFSNNNGKTSSTKIVGFITSMVCLLIFITLVIYYLINPLECSNILEFIDRTTTYFTVSAGLMGIKSVTSAFGKSKVELTQVVKSDKQNNNEDNLEEFEDIQTD